MVTRKRPKSRPHREAIEVAPEELRRRFNEGNYEDRKNAGEFREFERYSYHPSPPPAEEPECTHTQMIAYLDHEDCRIVNVHQFLRKDGTIGAKGRPDPKAMLIDDILYYVPVHPEDAL
jgi:hypothetical protein